MKNLQNIHISTINTILRKAEDEIYLRTHSRCRLIIVDANELGMANKTPKALLQLIADVLDMFYDDYKNCNRRIKYLHLRYLGAWFVRKYFPDVRLKDIGKIYGQDHSSIINAITNVEYMLETKNEEFMYKYIKVSNAIIQWLHNEQ